eukprot:13265547-Ditylum_brightwellii.AAC.1
MTVSPFVYTFWYIQSNMKSRKFTKLWKTITRKDWDGEFLCQPLLSERGYPLKTCSLVFKKYDQWLKFIAHVYEGEKAADAIRMTAEDALKLVKNPEVKVQLAFIVAFGESYWTPGYNWIRQKDKKTMLEGHCCHKALTEDLSVVVIEGEKCPPRNL